MQLTEATTKQLKIFSNIYPALLFRPGNVISTCTKAKNFFATATIAETFDREFGIYDLRRFLAVLSLFENPDLIFEDKCVKITDGKRTVKYFYAEKATFDYPPEKIPQLPTPIARFTLSKQVLNNLLRATGILKLPELRIVGGEGKIELRGINSAQPTDNTYNEILPDDDVIESGEFVSTYMLDLFKIELTDYEASITERALKLEKDGAIYLIANKG